MNKSPIENLPNQMSEDRFKFLTPEEKKKYGVIENRRDLFETRILKIVPAVDHGNEDELKNVLVATRDPGSGSALMPVMKELVGDEEVKITAVTDGRAQEIIKNNFLIEDKTPKDMILSSDRILETPNVILMDRSGGELGLDTYTVATYPEIPKVLVEDYPGTCRIYLKKLSDRNLPMPEKICVMDQVAKDIIVKDFPDLEARIEITGQPAFDKYAAEDTEKIAFQVKKRLGLKPMDKLVSYMSTMDEPEKVREMAEAIKQIAGNFYFVFRRHPRDNTSYEIFKKILTDAGIRVLDTDQFSTDEIGAASDIVLTTWSTEGLNSIYRRKPTVNIVDFNFRVVEGYDFPLAQVKLGASVGLDRMSGLTEALPQLLDEQSQLNQELREEMEENYPADGQNAKRVADIVRRYIK
jgi:hypothetical protein